MNKATKRLAQLTVSVIAAICGLSSTSAAEKADTGQDKPLPRVLLIGDSICGGYQKGVKKLLKGKVVVVKNAGNAQHTGTGVEKIDEWLGDGDWDLIHFNWGLWDLAHRNPKSRNFGHLDKVDGTITTPLPDYEDNLRKVVARLKKTAATLVWASTTPVPDGEPGRIKGDDLKYNAAAARIMTANGIAIDDLHAEVIRMGRPKTNNVHDTGDLSGKVAGSILAALPGPVAIPGRWPIEKAQQWHRQQPWLVGCNFTPSTAINQLEMWQADTFDPETIDRELGWAADIGMNTVRVYLHDLPWNQDSEGFLKRTIEKVDSLKPSGRPILCTEYLARGAGSRFEEQLPYFSRNKIAAYNWGWVAGKIQTQYPWASWRRKFTAEPKIWHHDVLKPDGSPHIQSEVELIKSLTSTKEK